MVDVVEVVATLLLGVATLVAVFFIVMPFRLMSRSVQELVDKIPGPRSIPVFGSMFEFNLTPEEVLPKIMAMVREYGNTFKICILGEVSVILNDPDDVETILTSIRYIDKSISYYFLQPWLGTGLFVSTGSKWKQRRKILTPAFHFKILEDYVSVFNRHSAILVEKLTLEQGQVVDINALVTLCTLDVFCEAAMGTSMNAQLGEEPEYFTAVHRFTQLHHHRYMSFWLHKDWIFRWSPTGREQKKVLKILHGFTDQIIKQRRAQHRENKLSANQSSGKKKHLSFLDLLIEERQELQDADIREEVDTFMAGGYDTTAGALCWVLFLLGHSPSVQETVFEELSAKFGHSEHFAPTQADLHDLPYLDMVLKEALRIFPTVPAFSRSIKQDVPIKNGYVIPAGSTVIMFPYLLHRNPEYFPEPERFKPDNFLPERVSGRHTFTYMPFSAGHRNCIGKKFAMLEEKAVLSAILRKFTVTSVERREDVTTRFQLTLKPQHGLKMVFTPRTNTVNT